MNWFVYRLVIKGQNSSKNITFTKRAIKHRVSYFFWDYLLVISDAFHVLHS